MIEAVTTLPPIVVADLFGLHPEAATSAAQWHPCPRSLKGGDATMELDLEALAMPPAEEEAGYLCEWTCTGVDVDRRSMPASDAARLSMGPSRLPNRRRLDGIS
ncbi:hypothetical protein [Streptomyces sp. NPDC001816]|uniref:hypothetical protein n=1 Tax=Streptomyces sp. NPDC001816 TaxID=3364612 RepID=UPI0036C4B1DE